jgi:hypothetical protein
MVVTEAVKPQKKIPAKDIKKPGSFQTNCKEWSLCRCLCNTQTSHKLIWQSAQ